MTIAIKVVKGRALGDYIPDLARLRIQVFREYPYLYDGSEDYEANYLRTYGEAANAIAVLALDNGQVVGASTGVPMVSETAAFQQPFIDAGVNPATLFYCGESVLLPEYRRRGIYPTFFREREQFAIALGLYEICFCAVVRPDDHPLRPQNYQSLDRVWAQFGYQQQQDLIAHFPWKDIDQEESSQHPMVFWLKTLAP